MIEMFEMTTKVTCKKQRGEYDNEIIKKVRKACQLLKKEATNPEGLLFRISAQYKERKDVRGQYMVTNIYGGGELSGETPPLGSNFSLIFEIAKVIKRYKSVIKLNSLGILFKAYIIVDVDRWQRVKMDTWVMIEDQYGPDSFLTQKISCTKPEIPSPRLTPIQEACRLIKKATHVKTSHFQKTGSQYDGEYVINNYDVITVKGNLQASKKVYDSIRGYKGVRILKILQIPFKVTITISIKNKKKNIDVLIMVPEKLK